LFPRVEEFFCGCKYQGPEARLFHKALQGAPHQLVIIDNDNQCRSLLTGHALLKISPEQERAQLCLGITAIGSNPAN
jgi:hypothetical protein